MQRFLTIAIVTSIAIFAIASCFQSTKQTPALVRPLSPTPVSLPKVLDMPKSNESCIVCHLDFDDEPITDDHLFQGITCAHCHGKSTAHMHDETMMTSPDILYGRIEVEAMCNHCHQPHKNTKQVEAFRRKWLVRKRENGRGITADSICTDCHGLHTVARR